MTVAVLATDSDRVAKALETCADTERAKHRKNASRNAEISDLFHSINDFLVTERGAALKSYLRTSRQWIQVGDFRYDLYGSSRHLVAITGEGLSIRRSKILNGCADSDSAPRFRKVDKPSQMRQLASQDIDINMIRLHLQSIINSIVNNDAKHDFLLPLNGSTGYVNKYFKRYANSLGSSALGRADR